MPGRAADGAPRAERRRGSEPRALRASRARGCRGRARGRALPLRRTSVTSASACAATSDERLRRIRATSSRSATSASRSRFESSTAASGSTKSVWPEPEESCTIPGTRPRADAFSASTGRPPRSVTKSSWRCSAIAGSCAILRRRSASRPRPSRSSRRRRRSGGEAESLQVGAVLLDRPADLLCDREQRRVDPGHELEQRRHRRRARRARGAPRRRRGSCARPAPGARVSSVLPRAARSAASPRRPLRRGRARPPRRAARSPRSSAAGAAAPPPRRPTGGALRPAGLPARSPSPRRAGPERRGARAARGRALAWGECTAGRRVASRPAGVLPSRVDALPRLAAAARRETCCSPTAAWRRRSSSSTASTCRASPRSRCSSSEEGRAALTRYFEPYLDVARRHGTGFVLEANTWRANPSWGAKLGYSLDDLAEANRRCDRASSRRSASGRRSRAVRS